MSRQHCPGHSDTSSANNESHVQFNLETRQFITVQVRAALSPVTSLRAEYKKKKKNRPPFLTFQTCGLTVSFYLLRSFRAASCSASTPLFCLRRQLLLLLLRLPGSRWNIRREGALHVVCVCVHVRVHVATAVGHVPYTLPPHSNTLSPASLKWLHICPQLNPAASLLIFTPVPLVLQHLVFWSKITIQTCNGGEV